MIFGFLPQNLKIKAAVAVAFSIAWPGSDVEMGAEGDGRSRAVLAGVRGVRLAAAGGGDQPGADVLPCARAGQERGADDPGVAVLVRGRAGPGRFVVDRAAGRGADRPG